MNKIKYALVCFGILSIACNKPAQQVNVDSESDSGAVNAVSYNTTQPKPPQPSPIEIIQSKNSFEDALAFAKPFMKDSINSLDIGALLFAIWANNNLTWQDVFVQSNETSFARVMKDSDEERGKKMCVRGSIIEISTDKTSEYGKFYHGGMFSGRGDVVRFTAVKSTGDIVESSYARLCGIVTGKYSYSNSSGGTTHAINIVGMFDLPENKL